MGWVEVRGQPPGRWSGNARASEWEVREWLGSAGRWCVNVRHQRHLSLAPGGISNGIPQRHFQMSNVGLLNVGAAG